MRCVLTQHAADMMIERGIQRRWLENVLNHPQKVMPDRVDPALEHRLGRIAEHGGRVLRVVVNPRTRPTTVVTVYFDRTMKERL